MKELTLQRIKSIVHGECDYDCEITSVAVDSRLVQSGGLFVAIKGSRLDGLDYVDDAIKNGAVAVMCDRLPERYNSYKNILVVNDVTRALCDIAGAYKRNYSIFTAAVTGGVGKTTTVDMLHTILTINGKTVKTKGMYNSAADIALAMLKLQREHKNLCIEVGVTDKIAKECIGKYCVPNVCVFTNIGSNEVTALNDVMQTISSIDYEIPIIANADDEILMALDAPQSIIYYGVTNKSADVTAFDIKQERGRVSFGVNYYGKTIHVTMPAVGKHYISNALAAFCVGLVAEIEPEQIASALKWHKNDFMRSRLCDINGITVIDDCKNSTPKSMRAALEVLMHLECSGKRVCVLGEMGGKSNISDEEHINLGKEIARSRVDTLVCYGTGGRFIKKGAIIVGMKNVLHFNDGAELVEYLKSNLFSGDVVLFKASRDAGLDKPVSLLKETLGGHRSQQ